MSIRNLDAIFHPKSVALIGASPRPHSVGLVAAHNLLEGGFAGAIMPVTPSHDAVAGLLAYRDVASLPMVPDLAVICTPPETVPGLIADLAARGTKAAIVITAGFMELGTAQGKALQQQMLDAARPALLRIVGPNCLGVLSTPAGLNASFAPVAAKKGGVAFVAQSGAMLTTVLDWASARGIGFSHLVSLGDMMDVDFGDMLDYLANDTATTSILLYIETITQARKFMSAARAAARLKPVIAIKAGRHAAAAKAATSHTGAMAGVDAVYDAAFQRAGILRVQDLDEIFDAVETLAQPVRLAGDGLIIVTNGGGLGVLATDALLDRGGRIADLSPEIRAQLDKILPPTWSHGNPVDIIGDASPQRYADTMKVLLNTPPEDSILVLNCPVAVASSEDAAEAVADAMRGKGKPVFASWLGSDSAEAARKSFAGAGIPAYDTPDKAISGFMHLVRYNCGQRTLMEVPPSENFTFDEAKARAAIKGANGWLDDSAIHQLFAAYDIPSVRSEIARDAAQAEAIAKKFGGAVALKIFSPDITHKSDVGGVALNLDAGDVRAAADAMTARVAKAAPNARLAGFVVQEMITRKNAHELILGMTVDAQFGPVLLFGHGGTAAEVIGDRTLALPPLNLNLAREMMACTRIFKQLRGYRDQPHADLDAIALTLVKLSQLVCDIGEIAELDINPLLADETGVIALDARVRIVPGALSGAARLSISPYPKELEHTEHLDGFGDMFLRPIRPDDAPAMVEFFTHLTPEDVRMRFFAPMAQMPRRLLARLTQIDYDREMAFLLLNAQKEILGIGRLAADPDNARAEFAVAVRSDLKSKGLGTLLMQRLIAYAKARGTGELFGDVLENNERMLALARELGFAVRAQAATPGILRVSIDLQGK
jgi:acetyltransferase